MLRCVWPALNPLSIHVTLPRLSQRRTQRRPKCALCWLQKLKHVPLAITIIRVTFVCQCCNHFIVFSSFTVFTSFYRLPQWLRAWLRAIEADLIWGHWISASHLHGRGNQSGDLAISGEHGNAQEEYALRRRKRRRWWRKSYEKCVSLVCLAHCVIQLLTWLTHLLFERIKWLFYCLLCTACFIVCCNPAFLTAKSNKGYYDDDDDKTTRNRRTQFCESLLETTESRYCES